MAAAQTVAAGALLGSSKSFGLGSKGFAAGAQLGVKGASNGSRVSCRAALTIPKAREWLLAEAEKRWEAALESPLAGVQFTHDEFADALSKYDFSFEVGDMVRYPGLWCSREMNAILFESVSSSFQQFAVSLTSSVCLQVKGVVFKADHNGALIDIGAKAPAYLPLQEACIHKLKSVDEVGLLPGTEEEFVIIRDDDDNGRMILSLKKIQYDLCWERSAQMLADDVVVRGTVGQLDTLKPFCPSRVRTASQNF